ncbi:IS256 family transposase [Corynebacterium efficiens]|uniref:Mutator family transposase n=1 Tax=Corynebacterium efficiens (strain DSM 44549 / YS-314 / AJ 12310 / JCM 11189 / NBRC 100395) TaxID=196164 RepID=Q8CM46_COREF|nr:IS256 family transposase [Corynebacterium efficiens]BAC17050.1 putative transposase [Corynebacterium efficiens YS-314]BAC17835.1 putative transposase [Corynebacterium efficiens YS-314]BAC18275.1 putative transposase [Corynebacterium efficiens YS-314]
MTTVAKQDPADSARIKAIEEKLLANPEMAKLIDELGTSTTDANDLVRGLLQASINRGLNAEMDAHLGYGHSDRDGKTAAGQGNHRNGYYPKRVDSNYGPIDVAVPRDRNGSFLPTMVPKGSRRLTDVDDMIISLYAGGMTVRDIQHHMITSMGVDISHETISAITDAVLDEVMIWQNRQLDDFYPVIFLDALRIKVRDGGRVVNKSVYLAIGVDMDGIKHILGIWLAKEEGASFWANVCANLATRGVQDVFIVCCDGLKGLPQAVEATWPDSMVQTCVVHLIRAANRWVAYGDRKAVSAQLRKIYTAPTEDTAIAALEEFEASELGVKYPQSAKVWRDAWDRFIPFLQFPPMARKVIYTTNSIESMNNELRKATRNRVQFTNDESAIKTLWLMICNIEDKRAAKRAKQGKRVAASSGRLIEGRKVANWKQAINQMAVAFPDRFEAYL